MSDEFKVDTSDSPDIIIFSSLRRFEHRKMQFTMARLSALVCCVICAVIMQATCVAAQSAPYRLGPQDKIQTKVFDLRIGSGEAHQWSAFDGDFTVDSSGGVFLPIIGFLNVNGKTVEEIGKEIASKMQAKVGLAEPPSASVQVVKYRPFYITGTVEKPGEYDYRPNLSVLQAVSIAGGFYRSQDAATIAYVRDAMSQFSGLNILSTEKTSLLVRMARLEAEVSGNSEIKFPPPIMKVVKTDAFVAQAVKSETQVFESRRDTLASQLKNIDEVRVNLASEIDTLDRKAKLTDRQIELNEQDLNAVRDLMNRGLSVSSRQIGAEQGVASLQSSKLDNQTARLRAQQDLSRLAREAIDLRSKFRQQAILDLTEARDKLSETEEKSSASSSMLVFLQNLNSIRSQGAPVYSYSVSRTIGGQRVTSILNEGDLLQPGDVLGVTMRRTSAENGKLAEDVKTLRSTDHDDKLAISTSEK
ncbi:polysaccharide export protein [Methylobacterium sp. J-030]|uniref:polysaccharide biosynthesis/export family protein n=1 Tax=Methylobacterium sp. J-030 TaxID=2836627 RepID=UPI001FBB6B02|nr:polysaccharide biosynthesis/export family protein [Methylobacterium sp. J-030]MCJ2070026.1 polysaccharide export protein [Methylobacterium sp. J-030]